MNRFGMQSVVIALSVCGAEAIAGNVWYPNNTWSKDQNTAIVTPSMWSSEDGTVCTAISAEDDYVITNNAKIRFSSISFGGKSLTLRPGEMTFDGGKGNEFPRDGLILEGGSFYNNSNSGSSDPLTANFCEIGGMVTVSSPTATPFEFKASQYADRGTVFTGSLVGGSSAAFKVSNQYGAGSSVRMNVRYVFLDAHAYNGRVDVVTHKNTTFAELTTACGFYLGATTLPGTVAVGKGATFGAYRGTDACSVGTLSLARGSRIWVPYDATSQSSGSITAANAFSISGAEADGPIDVLILSSQLDDGRKFPVLSVPAGVDLRVEDFSLTTASETFPGEVKLRVEPNVQGGKTLFADCCVRLSKSDNGSYKTAADVLSSAFTNAASWTDGCVPHSGTDYFVNNGITFREIDDATLDYVFPARNLTILGGEYSTVLVCGSHSLEVTNLVVRSGANFRLRSKVANSPVISGETLELEEGARIYFDGYAGTVSTVSAEICGGGDIETVGERATAASSARGGLSLTGLNTNWTGRLRIDYVTSEDRGYPGYSQGYYHLYVSDERNIGGKLEDFDFKALTLAGYGRFYPLQSLTLSPDLNRGIFFDEEGGRFDVGDTNGGEGRVLTCNRTITAGGAIYKEGLGTLVLGGGLKFYDAENDAAVDEIPSGTTPRLVLMNGTLKIGAPKSCDGLQILVTNIANRVQKILIPANAPQGSDLARYGLYNVKAGAMPFVLSEGVATLPIGFDGQGAFPQGDMTVHTNALLTVANSAVENVRRMLPTRMPRPYSSGARMEWVEIPVDGEDATTFACVSDCSGFILSIR